MAMYSIMFFPIKSRFKAEMAWQCSAKSNSVLIENLFNAGLMKSERVRDALLAIDRRNFVLENHAQFAYDDRPLPIGHGVTISAPHMHAMCLDLLEPHLKEGSGSTVLDVGSGSGYLTAAMAAMVGESGRVVGIEHVPELTAWSQENIKLEPISPHISAICTLVCGDGRQGFADVAPFDAIHVGAAAAEIPQALLMQLKVGGRLVIPVGPEFGDQELLVIDRLSQDSYRKQVVTGVRYVPLTSLKHQLDQD